MGYMHEWTLIPSALHSGNTCCVLLDSLSLTLKIRTNSFIAMTDMPLHDVHRETKTLVHFTQHSTHRGILTDESSSRVRVGLINDH